MFRCCSLETSHPRLLPQSPKVCSIHLLSPVACMFSPVSFFVTPMDCSQAPLSMGFSRQEYWSELPFPTPEIFPTKELNPCPLYLLHCRRFFTTEPPGKPLSPMMRFRFHFFSSVSLKSQLKWAQHPWDFGFSARAQPAFDLQTSSLKSESIKFHFL